MSAIYGPDVKGEYGVAIDEFPRRLRAYFGGEVILDTKQAVLLHETRHLPVYYVPLADVRHELLDATDHTTHCPYKGDASYWSVRVGDRVAENAVWNYPEVVEGCPDISGYVALYWTSMDHWFEEDEEVFVHPRNPYKRIDVLESSRHVRVEIDGTTVADSSRPRLLFETDLPVRYYLPALDVRLELLTATATSTACPYKGTARYWSVTVDDTTYDDIVWGYDAPLPEVGKIARLMCFFNEKVDIHVDDELQARPLSPWSVDREPANLEDTAALSTSD